VVIGNSFGAFIARLFATTNPQYVPAVILVNGGAAPEISFAVKLAHYIPAIGNMFDKMAVGENALKRLVHDQSIMNEAFSQNAMQNVTGFGQITRMKLNGEYPSAQTPIVPTLLLWGAQDKITPLKEAEAIKASIPGATLTEIADCGHLPQLEAPDVFVWQVNTFLDRLSNPQQIARSGPRLLRSISG
jgi:pimeloyl-ACP methyl ester carboxylesterase